MATKERINQFRQYLTDQWKDPLSATMDDAEAFATSLRSKKFKSWKVEDNVTWWWIINLTWEETVKSQSVTNPIETLDPAGVDAKKESREEIRKMTDVSYEEKQRMQEEITNRARAWEFKDRDDISAPNEAPTPTPEPTPEPTPTPEETPTPEDTNEKETPREPTPEEKAKFPEWTFEWPSPVWVDKEWKLTTWITPLEIKPSEQERFATESWIWFTRWGKNQILFQPENLDQAIDLFTRFWPNVRIDKNSKEAISGSAIFNKYNKYRWADSTTLKQALINNDLWVGWETWNRLIKMNWWVETPEMFDAKKQYELWLQTSNINENGSLIQGQDITWKDTFFNDKEILDNAYMNKIDSLFDWLWNAYLDYKKGNTITSTLTASINETNAQIDELKLAKRRTIDEIRKENPNLPLWQQLAISEERLKMLDDQIFALQRTNSIDKADLKDEEDKLKAEYEFVSKKVDQQLKLSEQMYWIKRWDIVSAEKIAREDELLQGSIERAEKARKQAIIDWDAQAAKQHAYQIALLEEQKKISNKFQVVTPGANWVAIFNPLTWELDIKQVPKTDTDIDTSTDTDIDTSTPTWQGNTTTSSTNFSNPTWMQGAATKNNNPWNVKMSPVNESLAVWVDSQGHLIFPDIQTWMQALINDVSAKLTWRTSTGLTPESTLNDMANVYQEKTWWEWVKNIQSVTGYTWDTKLKDIDINKLIPWIVKAETSWVTQFIWDEEVTETDDIVLSKKQIFVMSQLPTKLKDSDEDKKDIREFVRVMHDQWLDQFEIADLYQWFEVKEWDNFWKNIRNFVWVTKSRDDMWEIGRSINKWVPSQALRIIYRNANRDAKDVNGEDYVSEQFTRVANSQVNKVLDFMWENWLEDWVWVTEWTFDKWISGKFRKKVSQQILTDIIDLTATLSTKLSWTAKTEAELKFIEDLLPDLWDSPANFFIKLHNLKNFPLLQFNEQMSAYWLPELDDNTLSNIWARMDLFENPDLFDVSDTLDTSTPTPTSTTPQSTSSTWWKKKSTPTWTNPFMSKNPFKD